MMRLMKERDALNIVGDQKGRPTYAKDLAIASIQMLEQINAGKSFQGIYHYANTGETTWYDFAARIQSIGKLTCDLTAIPSDQFPTPAKRPNYSVLDTTRMEKELGIQIPSWESALQQCMEIISRG